MVGKKKSVRVQMLEETEALLKDLAKEYGCLYDGEPSISMLLNHITIGRLVIKRPVMPSYIKQKNIFNIFQIRIEIYKNIVGTIAVISKIIADNDGNIIKTKVSPHNSSGFLYILLYLQDDEKIAKLVNELKEIKVDSIEKYNSATRLINNIRSSDTAPIKLIEELRKSPLIISITCTIGLKIVAMDKVGVLARIGKTCAEKNFLISGVEQEMGVEDDEVNIKLHLYLEEKGEFLIPAQIAKISSLMEDIQRIREIRSVERFAIESILEDN